MKKFFASEILAIILILITYVSYSQAPLSIPYQAVARNSSGNLIQNQTVALRFTIHSGAAAGTIVYQETQSVTTSVLGLFSVNIGQGTPISAYGTFSGINWAGAPKFMQVEIDVTGGTSYLDMGTQQMMSVPYALYAENSGRAFGSVVFAGTWDASSNTPLLQSSLGDKGSYYVVTVSGNHDLNGVSDWGTGDWAIFNGSVWEKVDNSETPTDALSVSFTPFPGIVSTNVQDAIEEVDSQFADLIDSFIHRTDDGLSIYLPPGGPRKRFGIGDTQPAAPLGVLGETGGDDRMISLQSNDASQKWNINLNPTGADVDGFSIDDASSGSSLSRFFIDHANQGNVGIGTVSPNARLAVSGVTPNGYASISLVNTASGHTGWLMGHLHDATSVRNGTFSILENNGTTLPERITILPTKNVGINESHPDATLHVTRPPSDPQEPVALAENTGILCLGPIDDKNLSFDSHQIQARTGSYVGGGSTLSFSASALKLQPHGGDVTVHGARPLDEQVIITGDGKVGLGRTPVKEKLEINGAVLVGDSYSSAPDNGTIRFNGTDFEGRKSGAWVSLTTVSANDGFVPGSTDVIYYDPASGNPKVGIGVVMPTAALHIEENAAVTSDVVAVIIDSKSSNSNATGQFNRVGLEIKNSLTWSSNASSKDIGIYVKNVTGQSNNEANLAAVLNGNTVIGDLVSGNNIVGTGGRNVLAIQNGSEPTSTAGSSLLTNGGIQIFSHTDAIGTSVFSVMNGDGAVIRLYRSAALTLPDVSAISPTTYGATEAAVIDNLRTRINELESKLQAFGLLQ